MENDIVVPTANCTLEEGLESEDLNPPPGGERESGPNTPESESFDERVKHFVSLVALTQKSNYFPNIHSGTKKSTKSFHGKNRLPENNEDNENDKETDENENEDDKESDENENENEDDKESDENENENKDVDEEEEEEQLATLGVDEEFKREQDFNDAEGEIKYQPKPLIRYKPDDFRNDVRFGKADEEYMILSVSHTSITPCGKAAGVMLCGSYPTQEYENRIEGAKTRSIGIILKQRFRSLATDSNTILTAQKYVPFLLCRSWEGGYNDIEYRKNQTKKILEAWEIHVTSEQLSQSIQVIETKYENKKRYLASTHRLDLDLEKRLDEEKAEKIREIHKVVQVPPKTTHTTTSESVNKGDVIDKSALTPDLGEFPFEKQRANQKFAAVSFVKDLTRASPEEQEPVLIWWRTFETEESFKKWMNSGAKEMLRIYDVDCVQMYSWLHPSLLTDKDLKEIDTVYPNGLVQDIMKRQ
jgi:hypothetical protein